MKVRLEFDLNDFSGETEYFDAKHGADYRRIIEEVQNLFRKYRKYGDFSNPEWRKKDGKDHWPGDIKKRYQKLADARYEFFNRLDDEFNAIMQDMPEEK